MAGAGYKLFNTGDVLTAAQVNTFLQEQVVMVFANATARTTALSGVLAEGMMSYLQDTNAVEVYNGSAWVSVGSTGDITGVTAGTGISGGGTSGDVTITNSMATAINAKADLIVGTANDSFDRLAVGSNGDTLVADSSTTTGLRWQADWNTGKNKIINGDFFINQRNFSSATADQSYGFDRWLLQANGGATYSAQTFTPGTAPVAGYESRNFARVATTGQSGSVYTTLSQRIESVRTFANQTVTISFWAKAGSGTPSISVELQQNFGTGGSPSGVVQTLFGKQAITTTWTRYSLTAAVPSISGKTIGTTNDGYLELNFWTSADSSFNTRTNSLGIQTATIDFWGVQVEAGSVATPFTTATGTLAGELAACQRYYVLLVNGNTQAICNAANYTATEASGVVHFPVAMRTTPTISQTTGTNFYTMFRNGANDPFDSFLLGRTSAGNTAVNIYNDTQISGTAGHGGFFGTNNASSFLAFQAEL